jgi:hypothetical protein
VPYVVDGVVVDILPLVNVKVATGEFNVGLALVDPALMLA